MSEYRYLLSDWDGTISNSLPIWFHACQQGFKECGVVVDNFTISKHVVPELSKAKDFGITDLDHFINFVVNSTTAVIHLGEFHEGAIPFLQMLADSKFPYALVTSTLSETLLKVQEFHQVCHLFPQAVTRLDVTHRKPHPEPVIKGMNLLGAQPRETLMIGDSHVDVLAGQAAAVDTVLYYPPLHQMFYDWAELKATNPTFIIEHWKEMDEILK